MKTLLPSAILLLALAGCGGGEQLAPLATDAGPADAGDDAAPPAADAGTVKRTVTTRSPFGGPAGNLLLDGDFEFSTVAQPGAQLGWRAYAEDGSAELPIVTETGGLCRSGLRCAVFPSNAVFFIRGTSPNGTRGIASAWARLPETAKCSAVRVVLVECDTFATSKQLVADKKGDDGWCHYSSTVAESEMATCIYVDSSLKKGETAILDSFVLGPDTGTVMPMAAVAWAPDAELVARLEALGETMRRTTHYGRAPRRPPPTP